MSEIIEVMEYCTPKVEGGVVKGVKIVGLKSRNGFKYSRSVLRDALPKYESSPVFVCHADPREKKLGIRSFCDHIGSLQRVHERHGGKSSFGLFANLHLKMTHPLAPLIVSEIEKGTAEFGLSHHARVRSGKETKVILEIMEVRSVDLVDSPATTRDLFEEEEMPLQEKLKAALDAREKGGEGISEEEFHELVLEENVAMNAVLETVQEEVKELRGLLTEMKADLDKKKKTRLWALEKKTDEEITEETGAKPIGDSHEEFLAAVQGV